MAIVTLNENHLWLVKVGQLWHIHYRTVWLKWNLLKQKWDSDPTITNHQHDAEY